MSGINVTIEQSIPQINVAVENTVIGFAVVAPDVEPLSVSIRLDLTQGPPGPAGSSATFIYNQAVTSNTWLVNHNLGFYPGVELMNSGSVVFEANIIHANVNQFTVYLNTAMTGTARCN